MISTIVKVADDGTIKIPPEIWKEAGVALPEEVKIEVSERRITLFPRKEPVPLTEADRENLERIGELLRESFAGADAKEAWEEIHAGRRDRSLKAIGGKEWGGDLV